jgi:hypothetical protein
MSRIGSYPVTDTVKASQRVVAYDPNGQATVTITISQLLDYIVQNQDIPASEITFDPDGTPYTVDNVQDALVWINDALETHVNNTTGAHTASAVSFDDTSSNLKGANVKLALENAGTAAPLDFGVDTDQLTKAQDVTLRTTGSEFATYGGTADVITLTTSRTLSALTAGQEFRFRATAANTGATTINVDGIGAVTAKTITGAALPANYIRTDVDTLCTYDGTDIIVERKMQKTTESGWTVVRYDCGEFEARIDYSPTTSPETINYPVTLAANPQLFGNTSQSSSAADITIKFNTIGTSSATIAVTGNGVYGTNDCSVLIKGDWY